MAESSPTQRIIPGAPPPAPLSKTQKKRRKAKAGKPDAPAEGTIEIPDPTSPALVETAQRSADVEFGAVASELVKAPESEAKAEESEELAKPSPIVEIIHKRLKATTKKISRISSYASADPNTLNEDQQRLLNSLPALEAVQKELSEVKKVIEGIETDAAREKLVRKAEEDRTQQERLSSAVSAAEQSLVAKAANLLSLLRIQTLPSGDLPIPLEQAEAAAIVSAGSVLMSADEEAKANLIGGFFSSQGDFESVPYSRLFEITVAMQNPPEAAPVSEIAIDNVEETQYSTTSVDTPAAGSDDAVSGVLPAVTTSSSFRFMQVSELETPFEDNARWAERSDVVESSTEGPMADVEPSFNPELVNGQTLESTTAAVAAGNEPIDWAADDEEGLPSLPSLHAKFGTSGSATPVTEQVEQEHEQEQEQEQQSSSPAVNGGLNGDAAPATQEEGFTPTRGRGRGRGSRADRGPRGNFRGGDRGSFRGGDRNFRGFRGDRGRGRGDWRGGEEFRGRGRGRGRGDRGGMHSPATPTTA